MRGFVALRCTGIWAPRYCTKPQHSSFNCNMSSACCASGSDLSLSSNGNPNNVDNQHMLLVDIGANLTSRKFSRDLDAVVRRARDAGVQKIMVTGTSIQSTRDALRLTRLFPDTLYCTAGVHPHDAKTWTADTETELRELATSAECVAIGECGLDFNRNFSPPDTQIDVFHKQVSLACELRMPLFIHERDAHTEMVAALETYGDRLPSAVIHCFTGTVQQARRYINMGLYIGLTGYLWKDKSDDGVRKILQDGVIPLDRLLLETDAPYMFPNVRSAKLAPSIKQRLSDRSMQFVHRYCSFQRNEPCSLAATAELIAASMDLPVYDVAMKATYNAVKLFGLST